MGFIDNDVIELIYWGWGVWYKKLFNYGLYSGNLNLGFSFGSYII